MMPSMNAARIMQVFSRTGEAGMLIKHDEQMQVCRVHN